MKYKYRTMEDLSNNPELHLTNDKLDFYYKTNEINTYSSHSFRCEHKDIVFVFEHITNSIMYFKDIDHKQRSFPIKYVELFMEKLE